MSRYLVSVDPGVKAMGVAAFGDGELLRAAYLQETSEIGAAQMVKAFAMTACLNADYYNATLRIERPKIYSAGQQKGDQKDIEDLLLATGAVIGIWHPWPVEMVYPSQWKGQTPKPVMCRRIESRLSEIEKSRVQPAPRGKRHNMIDAVGIGLHALGRLGRL